jgi:hypothetical protein
MGTCRIVVSAPEAAAERPAGSKGTKCAMDAAMETEIGTRVGKGVNRLTKSATPTIQLKSSVLAPTR